MDDIIILRKTLRNTEGIWKNYFEIILDEQGIFAETIVASNNNRVGTIARG